MLDLEFKKDVEYAVTIKEDVDYFPVIQGWHDRYSTGASATLFKPLKD